MSFPSISFFFSIRDFYVDIREVFLYNYYFKLHNILFTNLHIRIYRFRLIQLNKKNNRFANRMRFKKTNKKLFSDKNKFNKSINNKTNMKTNTNINKHINTYDKTRVSNFKLNFYLFFDNLNIVMDRADNTTWKNTNRSDNKNWRNNKQKSKYKGKQRKKSGYVFINKFKDCGNQYNFDPFYPYTTYKLNDFDFSRVNKLKKLKPIIEKKNLDLSSFDPRLKNINLKSLNEDIFLLVLDIYKKQKENKDIFLHALKNNMLFFYSFLSYLKKRMLAVKVVLLKLKKQLRSYVYKLNWIYKLLSRENRKWNVLKYFNKKKRNFFELYKILIACYSQIKETHKYHAQSLLNYRKWYLSLFQTFKRRYYAIKQQRNEKKNNISNYRNVSFYEKLHNNISGMAKKLSLFKFRKTNKWDRQNMQSQLYITIGKYITLYRSLFKYLFLQKFMNVGAIIYIKATATNVFLYFIYNNKILYKKSCGELVDVKKKERRFWRNVYPLVESFLPFLTKAKNEFRFPFVSLYLNGSDSLCSPLLSSIRKHNKKFRKILYFLFNEFDYFNEKTLELKDRFRGKYNFYPVYRLKFYSILDGFNRLSKVYFAINKIKDITSWPYNGCKKKKKKMLDNVSPFKQKKIQLRQLNCFQFFSSRFGIGHSFSLLLCNFTGLHPFLKLNNFLDNYFNSLFTHFYILKRIKFFFLFNKNKLDHFLHKEMIANINILKNIRCLKGIKHSSYLPVRGQRNKTNARTRKNIYLGNDKKNKKGKKNKKNNTVKKTKS